MLLPLFAGTARAQTSADLTFASKYLFRGVILSNNPVAQLRIDHDIEAGWYAGGFVSPATLNARSQMQVMVYGGRADRLSSNLSVDLGFSRTLYLRDSAWNYHEFYAGITLRRASARVFYSPSEYAHARTAYLDLSSACSLTEHMSLVGHVGTLHVLDDVSNHAYRSKTNPSGTLNKRFDARLMIVANVGDYTLQTGWQGSKSVSPTGTRNTNYATVSASLHF